jgi:predicted transcriptional regulator
MVDRISDLMPNSSMELNLKHVLTPPGLDPSAEWDEETKTVRPIHELEYFRPSAHCLPSNLSAETEAFVATQQSQQDDLEHDKENIRIMLFSDTWLKSTWFFLDCVVQTSQHAEKLSAMISRQYQTHDPGTLPWCPRIMDDFVKMFWATSYFVNSHIRQMPTLAENRLEREEAKSIVKGVFHAMLPYMLFELVEKHGMTNRETEGFRGIVKKFPSNSHFERVEVFGIASLAMYQRSKTPSIVGGSDFHDEIVAPAMQTFLHSVIEVTGAEKVGKSAAENARDASTVLQQMEKGRLVIPNILDELYQKTLKELPASVDRLRSNTTETVTAGQRSSSKRKATAKADANDGTMDATSKQQQRHMQIAKTDEDGVSDTTGGGQGSSTDDVVNKIHSYLDSLLDDRFQYSPRTVLLQIAMVTKFQEVDELRRLFQRCGMDTQSQSSSEDDDTNQHGTTYYRRSLVVREQASEDTTSEGENEEQELEQAGEASSSEASSSGDGEYRKQEWEQAGEESSSEASSSGDDVTLRALMQQGGRSNANKRGRDTSKLPKQQREVDGLGADDSAGSSEDEDIAVTKRRVQGWKKRIICESDSDGSQRPDELVSSSP